MARNAQKYCSLCLNFKAVLLLITHLNALYHCLKSKEKHKHKLPTTTNRSRAAGCWGVSALKGSEALKSGNLHSVLLSLFLTKLLLKIVYLCWYSSLSLFEFSTACFKSKISFLPVVYFPFVVSKSCVRRVFQGFSETHNNTKMKYYYYLIKFMCNNKDLIFPSF